MLRYGLVLAIFILASQSAFAQEKIATVNLQKALNMVEEGKKTMEGINNGVLTEDNKKSFSQILAGVRDIVMEIQQGKGTLGMFLYDPKIYKNLEELSSDLKDNPWKLLYRPKAGKK